MRYLYGDSTPFPLKTNFLDTAGAATAAAVALLLLEGSMTAARSAQQEAKERAARELLEVEEVERGMHQALDETHRVGGRGRELTLELRAMVDKRLAATRKQIAEHKENVVAEAATQLVPSQIRAPLQTFWREHELPYTRWGLLWDATDGGVAKLSTSARTPTGLEVGMKVAIPEKNHWEQSFRVNHFVRELSIMLMGKGWLGGEKLKSNSLHKLYVVAANRGLTEEWLHLRKHARDPSDGLLITFREGDDTALRVARVNPHRQRTADPESVSEEEAVQLRALWQQIGNGLLTLLEHRSSLVSATLDEVDVEKLNAPATLAQQFIDSVAPFVGELASRSASTRELQLKRETGDGRREELFVPRQEFLDRFAKLTPTDRARFAAFSLDGPMSMTAPPVTVRSSPPLPIEPQATADLAAATVPLPDDLTHEPVFPERASDRGDHDPKRLWPDSVAEGDDIAPFDGGIPESSVIPPPSAAPTFLSAHPSGLQVPDELGHASATPPPLPATGDSGGSGSIDIAHELSDRSVTELLNNAAGTTEPGLGFPDGEQEVEPTSSPSVDDVLARATAALSLAPEPELHDEQTSLYSPEDEPPADLSTTEAMPPEPTDAQPIAPPPPPPSRPRSNTEPMLPPAPSAPAPAAPPARPPVSVPRPPPPRRTAIKGPPPPPKRKPR